ncbi:MAG: hypothetical protein JWL72_2263 [Ilumatobacteraceae bacterium]|nr:hypothetical protein [Ilumatobacteraceae bacterium]
MMRSEPATRVSTVLLEAMDNAWNAFIERTVGISEDEYAWEPTAGAWTVRRRDGDWLADWADPDPVPAPVTTIAWRCWHIAVDCLDSYSARLFGRRGTELTGTAWVADWPAASVLLDRSWSVFRSGVFGWTDDQLLLTLGPAWGTFANHSNLDLALHALREVVHHGSEIALLRDLYGGAGDGSRRLPVV